MVKENNQDTARPQMEENSMTFAQLREIVTRRRWSILVPMVIVFGSAILLALFLPQTFKSTSTMLIESQIIPREFVESTISSYAEQRLQSINHRVMSTTKLLEIIKRYNLYRELKSTWGVEEIAGKMRKDIKLEIINGDVVDPRSGGSKAGAVAFTLSYSGKEPTVVQEIANVLVTLYLEENLRVREEQTSGTTKFLEEEMKSVQASIAELDGQITFFKERNINALPELSQANLQWSDRLDTDMVRLNEQLRSLKEREGYLQTQLAATGVSGFDSGHLIQLRRRLELRELHSQLENLKKGLPDNHPELIRIRDEITAVEKRNSDTSVETEGGKSDDPLYVAMNVQLAGTRSEIVSIKRQLELYRQKNEEYQRRIRAAPRVEQRYKILLSLRNNLQLKQDDLMRKYMESKVAHSVEKEQLGERFTLIDSARLPEKPVSPNIPAIILMGIVLGIGCGIGLAALREFSDQSVRSPEALFNATGITVLAGIPDIIPPKEFAHRNSRWWQLHVGRR
jgi:polysaccharide biosynthesis transport protein